MTLFASDLDRTLIYSPEALLLPPGDELRATLLCVERRRGREVSFMTRAAARDLSLLVRADSLVPVTARSAAEYRRILWPGRPPQLALVAHGGRLLREGRPDREFALRTRRRLSGTAEVATAATTLARLIRRRPFVSALRQVDDLYCLVVVDPASTPEPWLAELAASCETLGWRVVLERRKVYCLPGPLDKGAAARDLAGLLGCDGLLAAGDSPGDESLVRRAEAARVPAHGALAGTDWTGTVVQVTRAAGVLAGEEIACWARRLALPATGPDRRPGP